MEKIGATVLLYALLAVLLLQFSSLVGAVDILFFTDPSGCNGGGAGCYNVGPRVCCAGQGGSVLVTNAGNNILSEAYRDGGCTTLVAVGRGEICYVGGDFTGALWYFGTRRSLLAGSGTKCDSQMKPNSVFFTEDSTKGHWVLTSSDADRLYLEMQTVLDVEKLNWLKSLGAIYKEF